MGSNEGGILCRHCSHEVERGVPTCPYCGGYSPGEKSRTFILLIVLGILILFLFYLIVIKDFFQLTRQVDTIYSFPKTP